MKVAILGSGGREHVLVWKLSQSPRIKELFCIPGNPGIAQLAKCVPLPLHDHLSLIHWAKKEEISQRVNDFALDLCNNASSNALMVTKQLINQTTYPLLEKSLEMAVQINARVRESDDFKKGVTSFLNKEKTKW